MQIAHHESCHAVAALHYGRQVDFVGRDRHNGLTTYAPDVPDGDLTRYAIESGVICLAPFFEDPTGSALDLATLDGLLAEGVSLSKVWEEAAALVADPEYRRKVRAIETALWGHPVLSGEEIVLLLAASRSDQ